MTATPTPSGRILVVDDRPANLRVVSALLSRHGYEVLAAATGDQALAMAAVQTPDLILLDMMMPGMDGFALLSSLKRHPALSALPVVFLTAAHDRELLLRAFDAGAVDYVTKPFLPEELLARVNAQVGLKLTRDRLERVAHERQQLVNLVAHDLKNPLSSVLFASERLLGGDVQPERIPRYLQMIQDSANDALGYIKRYLEAQGRAATARPPATNGTGKAVPLHEVFAWLADRYGLQLEGRGRRLLAHTPAHPATVGIDGLVLRQVTENLISNAMKYAPGSDIELSVREGAPGCWRLVVEDRGPGIPSAQRGALFVPFQRLVEHDPAGGLSSGLGLALARQIVDGAGGRLWYEDREGGGARFVIELPQGGANLGASS